MGVLELSKIESAAFVPQSSVAQKEVVSSVNASRAKNSGEEHTAVLEENVLKAIDQAQEMAKIFNRSLNFRYLKEADRYQVEVVDESNGDVIRRIPPDEIVGFIEHVNELIGSLFDKEL